jgi:FKBP-type peptidyl-prolyl cis-trans isomerase (trigger factor)
VREVSSEGARHVYRARIPESEIARHAAERLAKLADSLRLPGFRPGKIPRSVLEERYGAQCRSAALQSIAGNIAERGLPAGCLPASCKMVPGAPQGEVEIEIAATRLADLPDPDLSQVEFERLNAPADSPPEAAAFLRDRLKSQVLDHLDDAYRIPILPGAVEREFSAIWQAAESQGAIPSAVEERNALDAEFHRIAERRLRLGVVVNELGRRLKFETASPSVLEDQVIDHLVAQARVIDGAVSLDELREMMG